MCVVHVAQCDVQLTCTMQVELGIIVTGSVLMLHNCCTVCGKVQLVACVNVERGRYNQLLLVEVGSNLALTTVLCVHLAPVLGANMLSLLGSDSLAAHRRDGCH